MLSGLDAGVAERRAAERFDVEVPSSLSIGAGKPIACTVLDLSVAGFRAALTADRPLSGTVWIRLPGQLATEAAVRWHRNGQVGALFDVPFHPSLIRRLVLSYPRHSGQSEHSSRASSVADLIDRLRASA